MQPTQVTQGSDGTLLLLCGRYTDGDLVQRANGTASLLFGAIIVLLSYATLAPFFLKGETNTSRTFGPFTPARERSVGAPTVYSPKNMLLHKSG